MGYLICRDKHKTETCSSAFSKISISKIPSHCEEAINTQETTLNTWKCSHDRNGFLPYFSYIWVKILQLIKNFAEAQVSSPRSQESNSFHLRSWHLLLLNLTWYEGTSRKEKDCDGLYHLEIHLFKRNLQLNLQGNFPPDSQTFQNDQKRGFFMRIVTKPATVTNKRTNVWHVRSWFFFFITDAGKV